MKKTKINLLSLISLIILCCFAGQAAADDFLSGKKLGFGIDRDFGVIASNKGFNAFIGNKGLSLDLILKKEKINVDDAEVEIKGPVRWYLAGGGYGDWNGGFGVRAPVGIEWDFTKKLDVYSHLIPSLQIADKPNFGLDFGLGLRYQF